VNSRAPAAKISRAEQLAAHIEESTRDRQADERLGTKEDLRREFRVAVGTLNEAIRLLQIRGVVEARPGPGGGLFVARPTPVVRLSHLLLRLGSGSSTAADALEVRNALELILALRAAEAVTAEDIAEMYVCVERMGAAVGSPPDFLAANWSLHRKIAAVVPNEVLRSVYVAALEFVEEHTSTVTSDATFARTSPRNVEIHRELVASIEARDHDRIVRAVEAHTPPLTMIAPQSK
jgi:DNA-binding FadR family transcriptional regulator